MSLLIGGSICNNSDVCRLCLGKDREFVNVFASPLELENVEISSLVQIFGNTPVTEDDGLPAQICLFCLDNLINCFKFRLEIQRNYDYLIECLKNTEELKDDVKEVSSFSEILHTKPDELLKKEHDEINDDDFNEVDIDNDDDYKPSDDIKIKKKVKKDTGKKRKKKMNKDKCKQKRVKTERVVNKERKSSDKLSAALQKKLENRDKCPLCFEKLKDNETMADHFYSHYNNSNLIPLIVNGKKTNMCNLCNKSYKFNSLIPHHRKHLKLYPFKCEIEGCDKAFSSTMNLGWHLDNHNGVKKYQCQTCGKTFHLSGSLRNHEETHIIEREQCKICHKTYKNHVMLKLHMKRHIYGQRHKCEEPGCDKAFYSAQELRGHAHTHYGSKTFVCDVCSKPWYTEKQLLRHKKYHEPVKQHQCSECMKTFVDKSQLRYHEMTHRGERPHVCEYCNTAFIVKNKLKRHQMKSCKGAKNYQVL